MWVRFPLYLGGSANKRSDLRDLGREAHKPYREALVGRPRVVCCRKSTHCRYFMWVHGTWAGNVRDGHASCVVEKVRTGATIVLTIAERPWGTSMCAMWVHGTWAGNVRDGPAPCVVVKVRTGATIVLTIAERPSDNKDSQLCSNPLAPRES